MIDLWTGQYIEYNEEGIQAALNSARTQEIRRVLFEFGSLKSNIIRSRIIIKWRKNEPERNCSEIFQTEKENHEASVWNDLQGPNPRGPYPRPQNEAVQADADVQNLRVQVSENLQHERPHPIAHQPEAVPVPTVFYEIQLSG